MSLTMRRINYYLGICALIIALYFSPTIFGLGAWATQITSSYEGKKIILPFMWHSEIDESKKTNVAWIRPRVSLSRLYDSRVELAPPYNQTPSTFDFKRWRILYGSLASDDAKSISGVDKLLTSGVACGGFRRNQSNPDQVAIGCVSTARGVTFTYSGSINEIASGFMIINQLMK